MTSPDELTQPVKIAQTKGETFHGWWITAACFLTFGIAVGWPYYNMPFFYDYYQRSFHWSKAQITFGFPLAALLTLWIGPVLVPRFSPRRLILVGTAMTCCAFVGFGLMRGSPLTRRAESSSSDYLAPLSQPSSKFLRIPVL